MPPPRAKGDSNCVGFRLTPQVMVCALDLCASRHTTEKDQRMFVDRNTNDKRFDFCRSRATYPDTRMKAFPSIYRKWPRKRLKSKPRAHITHNWLRSLALRRRKSSQLPDAVFFGVVVVGVRVEARLHAIDELPLDVQTVLEQLDLLGLCVMRFL